MTNPEPRSRGATLWEVADAAPAAVAVEDGRRVVSWAELDERTNAVGHGLAGLGVAPGEHVALVAGNRAEFVDVVLGAQRGGFVVTPVKTGWTPGEIRDLMTDADTRAVVTDSDAGRAAARDNGVPVVDLDDGYEDWLRRQGTAPLDGHGFRMSYTSGTTGRPKGVVHAWAGSAPFSQAFAANGALTRSLHQPPGGVHLMLSQMFHGAPLMLALGALATGATLRVAPRWSPETALDLLADGVRSTSMVPTMFRRLLALPDERRRAFRAPELRCVLHGGEPCPRGVKQRMLDWFGPILVEYYGFTEGGITVATSGDWLRRPGTVGRPADGQQIVVLDEAGRALPSGRVGRVHFRSSAGRRFRYHGDAERTDDAYVGDAYTAGDIGWVDADGFLYLTGRTAEVIVSAGVNVYPAEVEAVLADVPEVLDACVVGGPDHERGETTVAFVSVAEGVAAETACAAVDATCAERLAGYKRPRRVVVVDEIPRDGTGKLRRAHLRDLLWAGSPA